jgi:hypothetical protein
VIYWTRFRDEFSVLKHELIPLVGGIIPVFRLMGALAPQLIFGFLQRLPVLARPANRGGLIADRRGGGLLPASKRPQPLDVMANEMEGRTQDDHVCLPDCRTRLVPALSSGWCTASRRIPARVGRSSWSNPVVSSFPLLPFVASSGDRRQRVPRVRPERRQVSRQSETQWRLRSTPLRLGAIRSSIYDQWLGPPFSVSHSASAALSCSPGRRNGSDHHLPHFRMAANHQRADRSTPARTSTCWFLRGGSR